MEVGRSKRISRNRVDVDVPLEKYGLLARGETGTSEFLRTETKLFRVKSLNRLSSKERKEEGKQPEQLIGGNFLLM